MGAFSIYSFPPAIMTSVLPGERVPAQHVNLKLGPGLLQQSSINGQPAVVSTRAGDVQHSKNRARWWIEGNARRVSATVAVENHISCLSTVAHDTQDSTCLHHKNRSLELS